MATTLTREAVVALLADATPGPWRVIDYDAGDRDYYDHNGPCPSVQAPDDQDCAIVHWDGFKQEYWSSANGNQRQITANASLIASAPDLATALLAAWDDRDAALSKAEHDVWLALKHDSSIIRERACRAVFNSQGKTK